MQRFDQSVIDGSLDALELVRDNEVPGFVVDRTRHTVATRPNPYALGAWINHPPPVTDAAPTRYSNPLLVPLGHANVMPYGLNFPRSLYTPSLARYIPNKYYTSPHSFLRGKDGTTTTPFASPYRARLRVLTHLVMMMQRWPFMAQPSCLWPLAIWKMKR
jgi:hypothetical protein